MSDIPTTTPAAAPASTPGPDRRTVLGDGLLALTSLLLAGSRATYAASLAGPAPLLDFTHVPPSSEDRVQVAPEYEARVVHAWGDPITPDGPAYRPDGSGTAAEQLRQVGMHHDGLGYFPLDETGSNPFGRADAKHSSRHGLLVCNHEYTDEAVLHAGASAADDETTRRERVRKSQAANGVSVVEVRREAGEWRVVTSERARRVTALTEIEVRGPARDSRWMHSDAVRDPSQRGTLVQGTFANCANGKTPWGTYLTCEENFQGYFDVPRSVPASERLAAYGFVPGTTTRYSWHEADPLFDVSKHPREVNAYGWVVEIDPYEPGRLPVKRTALGRFRHENAAVTLSADGRVVVYMGDDQAFQHVYKFVSAGRFDPAAPRAAMDLLDEGTLYVARFEGSDVGRWIPLVHGREGLGVEDGFEDQADIVVHARLAGQAVGATPMDRPEWFTVHPTSGEVYVSLTNNTYRGAEGYPGPDGANPRARNVYGHVLRWRETGGDAAAETFRWSVFLRCGNQALSSSEREELGVADHAGNVRMSAADDPGFGSPDGLFFDRRGVLWIQTDVSSFKLDAGPYAGIGNNQMLAADPATGEVRRFLVGPRGCEVTGVDETPDGDTLFVNVQHPGEHHTSHWPDGGDARPRSATLAIRRRAGPRPAEGEVERR